MRMIKMVCVSCQQAIDLDVDHMMSFCPYCGKKLMFDADDMSRIMNRKMAEAPKPEEPKPETPSKSRPVQQAQNRQSQPAQSRSSQPQHSQTGRDPLWKEYWDIGYKYYEGIGVQKDKAMALRYFIKSAMEGKQDKAQYIVGNSYQIGIGTPVNYEEANKWFELSAAQGNVNAMKSLGENLIYGAGAKPDIKRGVKLLKDALRLGKSWSDQDRCNMAAEIGLFVYMLYSRGEASRSEMEEAANYMKFAESLGNKNVYGALAGMALNGYGVPQDDKMAFYYTEKNYQVNHDAYSAFMMGIFYEEGYGVRRNIFKAKAYLKEAAQKGIKKEDVKQLAGQILSAKSMKEVLNILSMYE